MFSRLLTRSFGSKVIQASQIAKVGVVGAGQMGTGIAIVANRIGGKKAIIVDSSEASIAKSRKFTEDWLNKEVTKGRLTSEQKYQTLQDLTYSLKVEDLHEADFIIEAVKEDFEVKKALFQNLDKVARPEVILASNTSSISITKLAASVKRPSQVIGSHFFNPVPVMKLVEIIRGLQTSEETIKTTREFVSQLQKEPVSSQDYPGFIVNRILCPYLNEAIYALYEGVATVEEIDQATKLGTNVPMGPLTLADFVGLDTLLSIMKVLHQEYGDDKYRPCPLLVNYVNAGYLGKKSGRGFYDYSKGKK